MTNAPKILGTDSLKQTYPKLNQAIDNANEAFNKSTVAETNSSNAVTTANEAKTKAESVQEQFNQVVIEGDSSVEAAQARVKEDGTSFTTLRDRLNDTDSQLAQKLTQEPFHLYVGANQPYKTIQAAVNEWKNVATINKQSTIIHISKGTYKESLAFYGENPQGLSFIGENSHDVIWKTTRGYYPDHPLTIGGNVLLQGITFIADRSENPSYVYSNYVSGTNSGAAYGLHIDVEGATGKVTVKDCKIYSYQNAGLGSGTRTNQEIELINTEIYSINDISQTKANGAWLYHNSVATGATNERLKARNVKIYSSDSWAIALQNYNADTTFILLEAINVNCSSGKYTNPKDLVNITLLSGATTNKIGPTGNSYGNNVPFLNNQVYYVDVNGNLPSIADCNLATMNGEYQISGAANAPTADAYFLKTLSANSQYKKQIAWKLTDNTMRYERIMSAGVWQAWALR